MSLKLLRWWSGLVVEHFCGGLNVKLVNAQAYAGAVQSQRQEVRDVNLSVLKM